MPRGFRPLTVPLIKGLELDSADNPVGGDAGLTRAENVDFTKKGGVQGRRAAVRHSGFSKRVLSSGLPADTSVASLSVSGYSSPSMFTMRDGSVERPGLMTRGRVYTYEGDRWTDRLGCLQARWSRLVEFARELDPKSYSSARADYKGCAFDFGTTYRTSPTATLLSQNAVADTQTGLTHSITDPGNGARCGVFTAFVSTTGANLLTLTVRNNGARTLTQYVLAADARRSLGYGEAPSICCDYDSSVFFVAYATTTPGTYKVLRVTTAGAVTHTNSIGWGANNPQGVWVTNSSVADNKVVVAVSEDTLNGVQTEVFSQTNLTGLAIGVTHDGAKSMAFAGQVVVGAAQGGQVWVAYTAGDGTFVLLKRSTTAATSTAYRSWPGGAWTASVGVYGVNATSAAHSILPQHQPIVVGGRVVLGISTPTVYAKGPFGNAWAPTSLWMALDITDINDGPVGSAGSLFDPVCLARGDGNSVFALRPVAAIVDPLADRYRFVSLDYTSTFPYATVAGGGASSSLATYGEQASLGVNEVVLEAQAYESHKSSTILAGAVPRTLSRGLGAPVGFPFVGGPSIYAAPGAAGGSLLAGSYTLQAIWVWVDDAGQKHYSSPSPPVTLSVIANQYIVARATQPHFNERAGGVVYTEIYCTDVNPVASAPHYKQYREAYDYTKAYAETTTLGAIDMFNDVLYTDGGVLEAQPVCADGGVATVGQRCWVSDGRNLYASRLGVVDSAEGPSWHTDGTLTLKVPDVAGRVVGLARLDDKLAAFCERGIYITAGDGPDDTGTGPSFLEPAKVSDLGLAGPRTLVSTPKGVFFQAANTVADANQSTGGLWLLDRSLTCQKVSDPVQADVNDSVNDLTYVPESELLVWVQGVSVRVFDTRVAKWVEWSFTSDRPTTLAPARGVLWGCGTEPMSFDGVPGSDTFSASEPYAMVVETSNISVFGDDGLGYGRARAIKVLGDEASGNHTLQVDTVQDESFGATYTFTNPQYLGAEAPMAHMLKQKCSAIAVTLTATPAVATWTALQIQTRGIGAAPTNRRQ